MTGGCAAVGVPQIVGLHLRIIALGDSSHPVGCASAERAHRGRRTEQEYKPQGHQAVAEHAVAG
jgi:hypothetical protein